MARLTHALRAFATAEDGATAIEYGLLAALFSVACIVAFSTLGNGISALFGTTQSGAGGAITKAANSID